GLPVHVEVSHMEVAPRLADANGVRAEDRSRESVLRSIGDLQSVRVVPGSNEGEHRAKDLLLRDARGWRDIREDRWRDEAGARCTPADEQPTLGLADVDEFHDLLPRRLVDDRSDVHRGVGRVSDDQGTGAIDDLRDQLVVDGADDHRTGPRGALLTLKAERAYDDRLGCAVKIGGLVHDHGVLSAHLELYSFEPALPGLCLCRPFEDLHAYVARSGEGDEAHPGI